MRRLILEFFYFVLELWFTDHVKKKVFNDWKNFLYFFISAFTLFIIILIVFYLYNRYVSMWGIKCWSSSSEGLCVAVACESLGHDPAHEAAAVVASTRACVVINAANAAISRETVMRCGNTAKEDTVECKFSFSIGFLFLFQIRMLQNEIKTN